MEPLRQGFWTVLEALLKISDGALAFWGSVLFLRCLGFLGVWPLRKQMCLQLTESVLGGKIEAAFEKLSVL